MADWSWECPWRKHCDVLSFPKENKTAVGRVQVLSLANGWGLRSLRQRVAYFLIAAVIFCLAIVAFIVSFAHQYVRGPIAQVSHHYDSVPMSSDACGMARFRLNQASHFSNAYLYREAYDADILGLKANQKCRDENAKFINEGFLSLDKGNCGIFPLAGRLLNRSRSCTKALRPLPRDGAEARSRYI